MTTNNSITTLLELIAEGNSSPKEFLQKIDPYQLSRIIYPRFHGTPEHVLCKGLPIQSGDVNGILVLGKDVANAIATNKLNKQDTPSYVYSTPGGDVSDFSAIQTCSAYFTSNPARTEFCAVQSVLEGKPTIIDVPVTYHEEDEDRIIEIVTSTGITQKVKTKHRWISYTQPDGKTTTVTEGTPISASGETGEIFLKQLYIDESPIDYIYDTLTECYLEAARDEEDPYPWNSLQETRTFSRNRTKLQQAINSSTFIGFQKVLQHAISISAPSILCNVHRPACIAKAKLVSSVITFDNEGLKIASNKEKYGIGLLRDERMWVDQEDIDILRVLLLGPGTTSIENYQKFCSMYTQRHGNRYRKIFATGVGSTCVARTLCMPISKFLPDDFDIDGFAIKHGLDPLKSKAVFNRMTREREIYHGCRGIRMFMIRPDLLKLWLMTVLRAYQASERVNGQTKITFLLATLTFPEEARRFIHTLEECLLDLWESIESSPVAGVATMLETGGAFISIEDILSAHGQDIEMIGGLVGVNDFTTACLNMNRNDAPKFMIPSYVESAMLKTSPFSSIETTVVGKAIRNALERSTFHARSRGKTMQWGLAGELAADWESVRWFARELSHVGLTYVSTSPETIAYSLVASASTRYQA